MWEDQNRPAILAEVAKRGLALANVPEEYSGDPDVVLAAVSDNPEAIKYADRELCLDRQFALEAVERNWQVVPFLPEALRSDRVIALAAVRKDRSALKLSLQGTFMNFLFTAVSPAKEYAECEGWYRLDPSMGLRNGRPVYVSKKRRRILVARGATRWAIVSGADLEKALADPERPGLREGRGGHEPDDCEWRGYAVQRSGALQDDPTLMADLVAGVPRATVAAFYEGESVRFVGLANGWKTTDSHLRFERVPQSEVPVPGVMRHRLTIRTYRNLSFQIASCIRPEAFRIFPSGAPDAEGFFRLGTHSRMAAAVGSAEAGHQRNFHIREWEALTISIYVDIAQGFAACLAAPGIAPCVQVWCVKEYSPSAEEFEFTNTVPPPYLKEGSDEQGPAFPPAIGPNAWIRGTSIPGLEVVVNAQVRPEFQELIAQARGLSEFCFGDYVTERDWDETEDRVALLVDTACFAVVGHCLYNMDEGQMWISQVAVLEALRGRGLGAELVVWAASEAGAAGYGAVRLKSATSAEAFYRRLRFKAIEHEADRDAELEELGFRAVLEMELLPPQMEANAREAMERAARREMEKAEHKKRQEAQLRLAAEARDIKVWVIVGGEDRGGVLVRMGPEIASPKALDRLSTGALVQQVQLVEDQVGDERIQRLHFRRLTGTGPDEGWITVSLNHKVLAEPVESESKRRAEAAKLREQEEARRREREEAERREHEEAQLREQQEALRREQEERREAERKAQEESYHRLAAHERSVRKRAEEEAVRRRKEQERAAREQKEMARDREEPEAAAHEHGELNGKACQPQEQASGKTDNLRRGAAEEAEGRQAAEARQAATEHAEEKSKGLGNASAGWTVWAIVGGEDRGGVLVRERFELGSPKTPERLSTGALVAELELARDEAAGDRLHFRRLTGTGPGEGWISVALNHKILAERLSESAARQVLQECDHWQGS